MTNQDIDHFVTELKGDKRNKVRTRGDRQHPTKELSFKYSGVSHIPAAEVAHGKQTDIYEFEKSYSAPELNHLINKWILFSIRAKLLSGKFYLVVNEKDKMKFIKIINEKSLDVEIIAIGK